MKTKKVIPKKTEEELVEKIIRYAEEHELTARNIREAVKKVLKHMDRNSVLQRGTIISQTSPQD